MPLDPPEDRDLDAFAEAVVQEIWNEMGRRRITSLRELARLAGMTHTSVNVRMNGDSRTGKRVPINVRDLYALGFALSEDPAVFVERAQNALHASAVSGLPTASSLHPDFPGLTFDDLRAAGVREAYEQLRPLTETELFELETGDFGDVLEALTVLGRRRVVPTLAQKRAARQIPEVANRAARKTKKKPTMGDE